ASRRAADGAPLLAMTYRAMSIFVLHRARRRTRAQADACAHDVYFENPTAMAQTAQLPPV
ncbi:MAG: hypothetical protein MUQ10_14955, partial [Anaerolineae bacterium]|nr:hypothetical protein [Anaerolineae bacterium]